MHNARHNETGNHSAVGITKDDFVIDHFLASVDNFFCRERGFAHDADIAPDMGVALCIGALNMENCHVRPDRANCGKLFVSEWAADRLELIARAKFTSLNGSRRYEGEPHSCCLEPL